MTDLGVANVILKIQIYKTYDGLVMSQSHYVEKIIDKVSKGDNSTIKRLIDISVHLFKNGGK
jgi:alpha-glucuronidase